jgi:hypothetical protein
MNSPRQARPKSTPSPVTYAKGYKPFAPMCTDRVSPSSRKGPDVTPGRTEGKESGAPAAATPATKTAVKICQCRE